MSTSALKEIGKRIGFITLLLFEAMIFAALCARADESREGTASWYADFSPGILETTANMERFDHNKLTCAAWDYPFGTMLEVTNAGNGKKICVRVNDRGPAARYYGEGRVIDLTKAAFSEIADLDEGLVRVVIRPVKSS